MGTYQLFWPLIRSVDPERAHSYARLFLASNILSLTSKVIFEGLETSVFNLSFSNPLGMAAGFDKNAEVPDALLGLGFGFVEIGTVTPRAQSGNARPRLFRLEEDQAIINRMGFNNAGMDAVKVRLASRLKKGCLGLIGANVGPNRDSSDPTEDCVAVARVLAPFVDYLVLNVSSPNTPGLRALQQADALRDLIVRVVAGIEGSVQTRRLLIKIAPDVDDDELADIAAVALEGGVDGIIATNTSISRPQTLKSAMRSEVGGLSGQPLFERSTKVLFDLYKITQGRLPLIGVGGISSGLDAYRKIRAGASLVQLYTAMVYQGPGIVGRILSELKDLLVRDGFSSVQEAVGADHR